MKLKIGNSDASIALGSLTNAKAVLASPDLIPTAPVGDATIGDYSDTTLGSIGTSGDFGYDSPAVARWNVVKYQDTGEYPYVGLVAFHVNEIAKVEFSINGGSWTEVTEMKENPSTGVYEYCVKVGNAGLDQDLEIRAKITPNTAGQVYGIPPILVKSGYSNELIGWVAPDGSDDTTADAAAATEEDPYRMPLLAIRQIRSDNPSIADTAKITIYCKAGEYVVAPDTLSYTILPSTSESLGWITIKAAPGVDKSQVVFTSSIPESTGGDWPKFGIRNLFNKFEDVSFDSAVTGRDYSDGTKTNVWLDGCVVDQGQTSASSAVVWNETSWDQRYATECSFANLSDGPKFCNVIRSCDIDTLYEDAIGGARLAANCVITNQDFDGSTSHPDFLEVFNSDEHSIFYNIVGLGIDGQGIFVATSPTVHEDIAFVNCFMVKGSGESIGSTPVSQIRNDEVGSTLYLRNLIIDSCTICNGQQFIINENSSPGDVSRDLVVRNTLAYGLATNLGASILSQSNNWFINTDGSVSCVGGGAFTTDAEGAATPAYTTVNDLVPNQVGVVDSASRSDIVTDARGIVRTSNNIGALG